MFCLEEMVRELSFWLSTVLKWKSASEFNSEVNRCQTDDQVPNNSEITYFSFYSREEKTLKRLMSHNASRKLVVIQN